jgi:hypothetical protein
VISSGEKCQATPVRAKNEPDAETPAALEIVSLQSTNAQPGMKVRFTKSIADCIDSSRHFAPARLRQFPNIPPKRF